MKRYLNTLFLAVTLLIAGFANAQGYAVVKLSVGDVWGDGSGYQMLLDANATAFGTIFPETGPLTTSGNASSEVYAEFEYKIPENADGNLSTSNIIINSTGEVTIPAGVYDWCITNPTPDDRLWIASANGNVGGRANDYVFEADKCYTFTVTLGDSNDQVDVIIESTTVDVIYDINVAGSVVKTSNMNNITNSNITGGTVKYDPATNTITLENAYVNGYIMFNTGISNALYVNNPRVMVVGNNTVGYTLGANNIGAPAGSTNEMTICGSGKLTMLGDVRAVDVDLTILDCEIVMDRSAYYWALSGSGNNKLTFNHAKASIKAQYAVGDFNSIEFRSCKVTKPTNHTIIAHSEISGATGVFVCNDYGTVANEVVIDRVETGVEQNETLSLVVYPNPANENLTIQNADNEVVRISDNMGRIVMETIYNGPINVTGLAQGVYAVKVGESVLKFVKK